MAIVWYLLLASFGFASGMTYPSYFTLEDLEVLFGSSGCIEGILTSMPQPRVNPVMTVSPFLPQPNNKNPSGVLMGFEADGVAVDQQRQQQQQSHQFNKTLTADTPENVINVTGQMATSIVNELATYNKIFHQYYLTNEQGPAHKKRFTVTLKLGEEEYTSEGVSIKKAQHSAASEALKHTQHKHPSPKSSRNLRLGKSTCGFDSDPNSYLKSPISLVHEIALKCNLAVSFEVEDEKGPPHMRTFVTKCTVGDKVTVGEGNGKKESKKRAAEKMLEELKKWIPTTSTKKSGSTRRKRKANPRRKKTRNLIKVFQQMVHGATNHEYAQNTLSKATIDMELFKEDNSPTTGSFMKSNHNHKNSSPISKLKPSQIPPPSQAVRPKDHLLYLSKQLGFQVQFSDFPKDNLSEFLSLVSLSSEPPLVCHGVGTTTYASHDQAALTALRALLEKGLYSVTPPGVNFKEDVGQIDGLYLTSPAVSKTGDLSLSK